MSARPSSRRWRSPWEQASKARWARSEAPTRRRSSRARSRSSSPRRPRCRPMLPKAPVRRIALAGQRRRQRAGGAGVHEADALAQVAQVHAPHPVPKHPDGAGRGVDDGGRQRQQRRLPGPVRAQHDPVLAGLHVPVDAVEDGRPRGVRARPAQHRHPAHGDGAAERRAVGAGGARAVGGRDRAGVRQPRGRWVVGRRGYSAGAPRDRAPPRPDASLRRRWRRSRGRRTSEVEREPETLRLDGSRGGARARRPRRGLRRRLGRRRLRAARLVLLADRLRGRG